MKRDNRLKIDYVRWEREDAIGKVTEKFLKILPKYSKFKVISLKSKSKNFLSRIIRIIRNDLKTFLLLIGKETIHFEEPKRFETNLNIILRNKKSILTVHHLDERKHKFDLTFFISKLKHRSFSRLIAISEKTKQDLIEQYGIDPKKITVAYNGVDHRLFKPTSKKVTLLKDKKYVLYLGSEIPRKNIGNLLKAFREISEKYPDLYLIKAGYSGGDQYRENTKRLIKDLGLTKKVIIVSKRLKEEELPLYYSNAELFVYPTLQEGFGMPLVEAMACGCPVVTSNLAPMNEVAKNQVLVDPYNFESIAKGMNKILSNKKYKEELIGKAIIRSKDFDWEKSAKKILKVYEELDKK